MIETDLRKTVFERTRQSVLFVRELKRIASDVVAFIDSGGISGKDLIILQNQLVQVRKNFTSWPYGSLTSLEVRQEMVRQMPGQYADAAAIQADFQQLNASFGDLVAALEAILTTARAAGQLIDSDSVTGLETSATLTSPDTDAVRATAITVRDSISGAV